MNQALDNTILILIESTQYNEAANHYADNNASACLGIEEIQNLCTKACNENGLVLDLRHTNSDELLLSWAANEADEFSSLIVNPSICPQTGSINNNAWNATLQNVTKHGKPVVEVHVNNIFAQQNNGSNSQLKPIDASGIVSGFGAQGFVLAIKSIAAQLMGK